MFVLSPDRPRLRITEGEASGRGGATGGGGGTGALRPVINAEDNVKVFLLDEYIILSSFYCGLHILSTSL